MARIDLMGIRKVWRDEHRRTETLAVDGVDLTIADGELVCLLGPSGCGKSTLLYMLAGLEKPTSGALTVDGTPVTGPSWERGMVFQDHALFPWRTVSQNVSFGLEARGIPARQRQAIVAEYLNLVGLLPFANAYPSQLSGGMQQRVGIARVLANDPKVLLMDEPFGSLDSQTRQSMQEELLRVWSIKRKTVVFVTHDIAEAVFLADRIVVLTPRPGRVRTVVRNDLPRPRRRTTERFIRYCELLESHLTDEEKKYRVAGV